VSAYGWRQVYCNLQVKRCDWDDRLYVPEHFCSRERKIHKKNFRSPEPSAPKVLGNEKSRCRDLYLECDHTIKVLHKSLHTSDVRYMCVVINIFTGDYQCVVWLVSQ